MSNQNEISVIVFICVDSRFYSDGEVYADILGQIKEMYGVTHIFPWTAAGPEGRLLDSESHRVAAKVDGVKLIEKKGVTGAITIGHGTCAGHPVTDAERANDVDAADKEVQALFKDYDLFYFQGILWPIEGSKFWRLENPQSNATSTQESASVTAQ